MLAAPHRATPSSAFMPPACPGSCPSPPRPTWCCAGPAYLPKPPSHLAGRACLCRLAHAPLHGRQRRGQGVPAKGLQQRVQQQLAAHAHGEGLRGAAMMRVWRTGGRGADTRRARGRASGPLRWKEGAQAGRQAEERSAAGLHLPHTYGAPPPRHIQPPFPSHSLPPHGCPCLPPMLQLLQAARLPSPPSTRPAPPPARSPCPYRVLLVRHVLVGVVQPRLLLLRGHLRRARGTAQRGTGRRSTRATLQHGPAQHGTAEDSTQRKMDCAWQVRFGTFLPMAALSSRTEKRAG